MFIRYMNYQHEKLKNDLEALCAHYPFLSLRTIGQSVQRRELFLLTLGTGRHLIHLNGAHHGTEWITSAMLMAFTENLCRCVQNKEPFFGENAEKLLTCCTLSILPMVNPDGVAYAAQHPGLQWQSNANGVDLNHNYPAKFYAGKQQEEDLEIFGPCASRFSGYHPFDQPETACVSRLIFSAVPDIAIAFHAQGREIYYEFDGKHHPDALPLARKMARASGYRIAKPSGFGAYSGMKDWLIDRFGIPAFTVEVGKGKNPLPIQQLPEILAENSRLILETMKWHL